MKKGIVLSPFKIDGTAVINQKLNLKHYLLYWDKIDIPTNNLIHISSKNDPDVKYLTSVNVVSSTQHRFTTFNGNGATACIIAQIKVFEQLSLKDKNSCKWSLRQMGNNFYFPENATTSEESILIKLYNSLPIPGEVSFDDILKFKEKRKDELTLLRNSIEKLSYGESIDESIKKLKVSIKDIQKLAGESLKSKFLSTVKIKINLAKTVGTAFATYTTTNSLPITIGTTVISTLNFEFDKNILNNIPSHLNDYAYLYYISNELQ